MLPDGGLLRCAEGVHAELHWFWLRRLLPRTAVARHGRVTQRRSVHEASGARSPRQSRRRGARRDPHRHGRRRRRHGVRRPAGRCRLHIRFRRLDPIAEVLPSRSGTGSLTSSGGSLMRVPGKAKRRACASIPARPERPAARGATRPSRLSGRSAPPPIGRACSVRAAAAEPARLESRRSVREASGSRRRSRDQTEAEPIHGASGGSRLVPSCSPPLLRPGKTLTTEVASPCSQRAPRRVRVPCPAPRPSGRHSLLPAREKERGTGRSVSCEVCRPVGHRVAERLPPHKASKPRSRGFRVLSAPAEAFASATPWPAGPLLDGSNL
jgi:hypothetical protein